MPKQEGDPPFGDDELLYRRLIESWIGDDGSVQPEAIDIPECSVDRALLSTAEQSLTRGNEHEIAVGAVRFDGLPSNFDAGPPAKPYELVVVPRPEPSKPAHAHIETRQVGELRPRKPGAVMKQRIRDEIAASMRVVLTRQS
jgi:hypothetical protein